MNKDYTVKTGKYYVFKQPIYKTVKVKKSKWVYKYKLSSEHWYGESEYYYPKTPKGYKWCGSKVVDINSNYWKYYDKYKKKVYYWDTKEVKTGKYKKAKDPIYMTIIVSNGYGQHGKGVFANVWSSEYWNKYEDDILWKEIKI